MRKGITLNSLSYEIGLLPGDVRSLIFEYDDTYRQILVQEVFPEDLSHVWKRRTKQWLMEYPYTNEVIPEGIYGEYVLFTYRRNHLYIHVLIAFVHVYYQWRIRSVPPDDLNMYLYQYNDTLTILENEGYCGRFHLDWKPLPLIQYWKSWTDLLFIVPNLKKDMYWLAQTNIPILPCPLWKYMPMVRARIHECSIGTVPMI